MGLPLEPTFHMAKVGRNASTHKSLRLAKEIGQNNNLTYHTTSIRSCAALHVAPLRCTSVAALRCRPCVDAQANPELYYGELGEQSPRVLFAGFYFVIEEHWKP